MKIVSLQSDLQEKVRSEFFFPEYDISISFYALDVAVYRYMKKYTLGGGA